MDSGNSGSISSSGDEEYDSRGDIVPPSFLNPHPQFGNSLLSSHHPPFFDVSPTYLHPNSNLNPFLNLDTSAHHSQAPRSEPTCTPPHPFSSSSSSPATTTNNNPCLLGADPSLQLRSLHHDDALLSVSGSGSGAGPSAPSNGVRNPKKRTRASRRAPTTVLTTDTSNFRAMVQEFTGIPAPPFSASSYSRRLDLLTASSSFRSSHPLRPSPHRPALPPPHPHPHPNPSSLFASPSLSSTLMLPTTTTMVDANAIASTSTTNYQIPPDHMLTMHILPSLHPFPDHLPPKSHPGLALPSLEDQLGITNANLMSAHQAHVSTSEAEDTGGPSGHAHGSRSDQLRSFDVACKLNFPASNASSTSFNVHDKNLDNTSSTRTEGNFDSWICSSD